MYGCFFSDDFGVLVRHAIGIDQITFESDYPHTDSTWPHTREVAEKMMAHLSPEVRYKILRGNAIRMLSLDIV